MHNTASHTRSCPSLGLLGNLTRGVSAARCLFAILVILPGLVLANANEDMGYARLVRYLGPGAVATGSGVPVMQIEASETGTASPPQFAPVSMLAGGTVAGSGNLSGKSFTLSSGTSAASSHAAVVADFFFGNRTDSLISPFRASMSPEVTAIEAHWAGSFSSSGTSVGVVRSKAWIGSGTTAGIRDFLRAHDQQIGQTGMIHVGGVNNFSVNPTPSLLAGAYNVIAVGLSNGNHSRGLTPVLVDEPNLPPRYKPDIVAPIDLTSWATAMVSSAATLLYASGTGAARDGLVVRASMFAGASREEAEFDAAGANWLTLSSTQPVHQYLGVGEVDVYRSHAIITSPQQSAGAAAASPSGWNIALLPSGSGMQTDVYNLVVPEGGFAVEISAAVVWDSVATSSQRFELPDITLELFDSGSNSLDVSNSTAYNVELVTRRNLPSGDYQLIISGPSDTRYAVAWLVDTLLTAPITLEISGTNVIVTVTGLKEGKNHRLQRFGVVERWETLTSFSTVSGTFVWNDTGGAPQSGQKRLYRVLRDEL